MKKKIIIGILIVIVLGGGLFLIFNKNDTKDNLKKFLIEAGFKLEDGLYTKVVSDTDLDEYYDDVNLGIDSLYEIRYFDLDNYQILMDNMSYTNGVSIVYSPIYDYKDNSLMYTYEVNRDNVTVVLEGSYKNGDFSCEVSSAVNIKLSSADKEVICNEVWKDTNGFYNDANIFIEDKEILKEIKKKLVIYLTM